ncbi:peptidoglycan D,D-transpeptidase FtsI family protein [Neomicrococcus aestuarii]|uniref:Peptidoglycan glycosyltransferase n=1 Tax=Neomicrococcus aestuarii TaxID=556325 RepID=A0A1L2ZNL9_9MICC|nr:penicillin-binding transpeptidase domain-containing protein [Neomicrococcus aestuarii]APF40974.1 peptidoglycan glycosyltransferase [Neomicrococcus aestuarii]MBB5512776.1 peptidoglycan glycosyltransferase [Neomicrococcus aestuarii]
MNQAIRNTWIAALALFLLVMGSLTYVQFFAAGDLNANALNTRQLYREFDLPRGAILVDGEPIAESVATEGGDFSYQRKYLEPELYAHLTGFYSLAYGTRHLESTLNKELSGQSDSLFYDRMVNLLTGGTNEGASVELTIEGDLQQAVYDALPDGMQATAIVTDPSTGDILAMASKPSYDPNLLSVHSTSQATANMAEILETTGLSPNINPAIGHLIAPGSTFKLIPLIAALESGKYNVDDTYANPTEITLPGTSTTLSNFSEGICANQTTADLDFIIAQSCNTPFVTMSETVGEDAIRATAERFGFAQEFQIPMRVTASVFPEDIDAAQLAMSSIGQYNTKATPLQMNMVAMGIANDGVVMKPNIIEKVTAADLRVLQEPQPEQLSVATTKEVADDVTELMRQPVLSGTAMGAAVDGVDLAAKTGTADIGTSGLVNGWITGFAPADNPQVAITVVVERISYDESRGTSSSIMKKILEAVFNK